MSYAVGGKQFVTVAAGNALFAFGLKIAAPVACSPEPVARRNAQ